MRCDNCKNHSDKPAMWPPCKLDHNKDEELSAYDPDDDDGGCPRFEPVIIMWCKNCKQFKPITCKFMDTCPELTFENCGKPIVINQYTMMSWCDGYTAKQSI